MEKNKNLILNIIILILAIALICVIVAFVNKKEENIITDENTLRDKLRENITYEYVTKPQEEENAMMAEQERIQNEEMQNEEARQQEEIINEMASNVIQSVKNKWKGESQWRMRKE